MKPKNYDSLSVDEAIPLAMTAARIDDEAERRKEFRRILNAVHYDGYEDGYIESTYY